MIRGVPRNRTRDDSTRTAQGVCRLAEGNERYSCRVCRNTCDHPTVETGYEGRGSPGSQTTYPRKLCAHVVPKRLAVFTLLAGGVITPM